ncbi:hypothetical protein AB0H86_11545 [Streptomyces sp. NPDC050997]
MFRTSAAFRGAAVRRKLPAVWRVAPRFPSLRASKKQEATEAERVA